MNREAYELRSKINQLKARLKEIEGDELSSDQEMELCASATCGHDVVLENLKKLCTDYQLKNLAVMAAWEREESGNVKWYSTNVSPLALPYLLRDVQSILQFLSPVYNQTALKIMEYLLETEQATLSGLTTALDTKGEELQKRVEELKEKDFLAENSGEISLTVRGWQTMIVLGHLTFVLDVKVPPEKAIPLSKAFLEVLHINWGDVVEMDSQEVISRFRETGWLERLAQEKVTVEDIEKAIYESRAPR